MYTPNVTNESQLILLYQAVFNHAPDNAGLAFWDQQMQNGMSLTDVIHQFTTHPAFQTTYGATADSLSHYVMINALYNHLVERTPEPAGLQFWMDQNLTIDQYINAFVTNTGVLLHNADGINRILSTINSGSTVDSTKPVDNSPVTVEVIKEVPVTVTVPGPTVFVNVPTPVEPTNTSVLKVDAAPDASSMKPATTDFITGSGIPAGHSSVVLNTHTGVEMTLAVGYRTGDMVTPTTGTDGLAHFSIEHGNQNGTHNEQGTRLDRSHASFTYSVNTGLTKESDHTFQLWIDRDPTVATDYLKADPDVLQPDFAGGTRVHQNSFNMGFLPDQNSIHYANLPVGTYDVQLVELIGTTEVARNHIVLDVI